MSTTGLSIWRHSGNIVSKLGWNMVSMIDTDHDDGIGFMPLLQNTKWFYSLNCLDSQSKQLLQNSNWTMWSCYYIATFSFKLCFHWEEFSVIQTKLRNRLGTRKVAKLVRCYRELWGATDLDWWLCCEMQSYKQVNVYTTYMQYHYHSINNSQQFLFISALHLH